MRFYNVRVGQETKRAAFNESLSFVCKTENPNTDEVRSYFLDKYKGLRVHVKTIDTVILSDIKHNNTDASSEKELALREKVEELKNEVKALNSKLLPEVRNNYRNSIAKTQYPEEVKELIVKIEKCSSKLCSLKESANKAMNKYIQNCNPKMIRQVETDKGFECQYRFYSYVARLSGELITFSNKDLGLND